MPTVTSTTRRPPEAARLRPFRLCSLFCAVAASFAWGPGPSSQEPPAAPPNAQGSSDSAAPEPDTGASKVPPELESAYVVRTYKVRPAKLWKGLLESLTADGYPPEEVVEEKRTVKTSFVDFKQDNYPLQVAEAPLPLGGQNHIVQLIRVRQGKFSLEAIVAPAPQGTELRVRARILVMGLDRVRRIRVFVDRRSTGMIESDIIHKLEARLGLEHL